MSRQPAVIASAGAVCSVGIGVPQVAASVRAGLSRFAESSVYDRRFEPMRMALLPETALKALVPSVETAGLTSRVRRMLRLAAPALQQAVKGIDPVGRVPVFVGLPEAYKARPAPADAKFIQHLKAQSDIEFDVGGSRIFPNGRAAALLALEAAVQCLADRRAEVVVVGGVDTFLDLALLSELDVDDRLLGDYVMDGFVPGEGAAFLTLRFPTGRSVGTPAILGVGCAQDPGHRFSDQPAKGEGLAEAIDRMLGTLPGPPASVQRTFGSLNGESFGGKEWGVARLRHTQLFDPAADMEHPADCFGDTGAACGALLLALAQHSLSHKQMAGPMLVWASSDGPDRACAYVDFLA